MANPQEDVFDTPIAPRVVCRDLRQAAVGDLVERVHGRDLHLGLIERGLRVADAAIGLARRAGVGRDAMLRLVEHVYSRPEVDWREDIGGVGVALLALCSATEFSADECEAHEFARLLRTERINPLHFVERQANRMMRGVGAAPRAEFPAATDFVVPSGFADDVVNAVKAPIT